MAIQFNTRLIPEQSIRNAVHRAKREFNNEEVQTKLKNQLASYGALTNDITQGQSADFVAINRDYIYGVLQEKIGRQYVKNGLVYIYNNSPKSKPINLNVGTANSNADWNTNGGDVSDLSGAADTITANLDAVPLISYDTYEKFSMAPNEWRDNFPQFFPSGPFNLMEMNPIVFRVFIDLMMNAIDVKYDSFITSATTGVNSSPFDGYVQSLASSPDVIQEANQGVITVSNILDIIPAMYQSMPDILNEVLPNMKFIMSYKTFKLTMQGDADTQKNATFLTTPTGKSYAGIDFMPISVFPDNQIVLTEATNSEDTSNLFMSTWWEGDIDSLDIYRKQGSINYTIDMRFAASPLTFRVGSRIVNYVGS